MNRKLKMGMIGGGIGAFIGGVHRIAANMDGLISLHCGAFSSQADISKASGEALFLPPHKSYASYKEMILTEASLPAEERMDFVSIVTPNHVHFEPAMLALEHGFHVVIDKPMTFTLEEAKQLEQKVKETGLQLLLTHTYSGYPMVKQAKSMVKNGKLGKIRKIYVEYPQGWLSALSEKDGNKQASWRTDPTKSGKAGCMGDIGTHAAHLAEYITGLKIKEVCADINIVVPGRLLDDDGAILLKFEGGASGVLIASQVALGEENALKIRVYGETGAIEWRQEEPNTLIYRTADQPIQIYRTGVGYADPLSSFASHNTRTPGGHPEGYLEAFANLYRNFALTLMAIQKNEKPSLECLDFPSVAEGVRGMAFIDTVIESGKSTSKWTPFIV